MDEYKFKLKCKFCFAVFEWPDKGVVKMNDLEELNQHVIICPGVKKDLIAPHCEIVGENKEILDFKERFHIMKEWKD